MKNIYIKPTFLMVQLGSRDAMLTVVSAESTLGARYGGTTSSSNINEADVKGVSDKSLWDSEW